MTNTTDAATLRTALRRLAPFLRAAKPVRVRRPDVGYGGGLHWIVSLDDGRSFFVKVAVDGRTAEGLRREFRVYSQLDAAFLPDLLRWDDDGRAPLLVVEDLSDASWPPPWDARRIRLVLAALGALHEASLPGMPALSRHNPGWRGWEIVAEDPSRLLGLGLCSAAWLHRHLDTLLSAAASVDWRPSHLVHGDVRSDNICFRDERPLLVDWSLSGMGSPSIDLLGWLPSLAAEGGPAPEQMLSPELQREAGGWAALLSGYYAARARPVRAGEAPIRNLLLARTSLPWAVRTLGLPPLDGDVRSGC